jgi:hypothetical protein
VFGPEARSRVWLVLDGDVLYVDRNGDGDLTAKDERLEKTHTLQTTYPVGIIPAPHGGGPYSLAVEIKPGGKDQETSYRITCRPPTGKGFFQRTDGVLVFGDNPKAAPVVHFAGPLTLTILDWHRPLQPRQLVRDGQDHELSILVGTPVFGGKYPAFATVYQTFRELTGGAGYPVVEVEFPGKDSSARPIRERTKMRSCE